MTTSYHPHWKPLDLPIDLPRSERTGKLRWGAATKATVAPAQWPLDDRINVVLFAGLGGACQGLEAMGCHVHVACNHDPVALAAHAALNPHTKHIGGDLCDVDPIEATGGKLVKVLWASPDCRDHSVAKGGAPRSPRVRSLPWQVWRWAAKTQPETIMLENVREIRGWGPLVAKRDKATGRVIKLDDTVAAKGEHVPLQQQQLVRDKKRLGKTWRRWVRHGQQLNYISEDRDLCCADFKIATSRRRLFWVAQRRGGLPIDWPVQTHAQRKRAAALKLEPWVPAYTIVDWSIPIPSIFDRDKELVFATERRIALGCKRYVLEAEQAFIIHLTHHGERPEIDLREPLPTITGAHRGEWALVGPTIVPVCHSHSTGRQPHDGGEPMPTMTTAKGGELAVSVATAVHLIRYHGERRAGEARGSDATDPLPTSTTENRFGIVGATLIQTGYGEREGQQPRALDIGEPISTQVAGGAKHGVIGAYLVEQRGNSIGQSLDEPAGAQTQTPHHSVIAAHLVQNNTGLVGHSVTEPMSTTVTCVGPQAVAAAFLVEQRGTATAKDIEEPIPSQTTEGSHTCPTVAYLTEYYGSGGQHQAVDEPLNTLSTNDRFALTGASITDPPLTAEQYRRAKQVAELLRKHGVWSGGEVVTFGRWVIVDLGMRMFQPHEAAAAHGLKLPEKIFIKGKWRPLTKTEAMRLVGNSVPPRMAELLARKNVRHALEVPRVAAE